MKRTRVVFLVAAFSGALACQGAGGSNNLPPDSCRGAGSPGWVDQVEAFYGPQAIWRCPLTFGSTDSVLINGSVTVDMLRSKNQNLSPLDGWVQLWTKNVLGTGGNPRPTYRQVDEDLRFEQFAPDAVAGEYPRRAVSPLVFWTNQPYHTTLGREDSVIVSYPTATTYSSTSWTNGNQAARWHVFATRPTGAAGSIVGAQYVAAGTSSSWRSMTYWDTTGYDFQWYIDGVKQTADTGAVIARTFSTAGDYTLRVDEIATDSTVATVTKSVHVPITVSISGPSELNPGYAGVWSASASHGTAPYSYAWDVDASPFSSGSSIETGWYQAATLHNVKVTVTDANSIATSTDMWITVNSGSCPPEDENCYESLRAPSPIPQKKRPPAGKVTRRAPAMRVP